MEDLLAGAELDGYPYEAEPPVVELVLAGILGIVAVALILVRR